MNIDLNTITASAVAIVPIIIAIVQAIKLTGFVKNQFAPLVSIAVGCIIAFLAHHDTADLTATLLTGTIYGLISSGLYSGVKTTMQAEQAQSAKRSEQSQNSQLIRTETYESVQTEKEKQPNPDNRIR